MIVFTVLWAVFLSHAAAGESRPNILICLADDQSWPHASAYGEPVIATPALDRIAHQGVLFQHAYCAAPSCTPSRSAILTGQDIWRLGEGGQLFGTLPAAHVTYTELLSRNGYHVGFSGKGWAPGSITAGGRTMNGAGSEYGNFDEFYRGIPEGKPWCFWFGSRDPHRDYEPGSGIRAGMDPAKVRVPAHLPDTQEIRSDLCDYFWEIQRFDGQVGKILKAIAQAGQLDNTLIVVTSDNGMPFPRAKANLYDAGARVPMAICWTKRVHGGRSIDDFINLSDLAPTFLEAAGIAIPKEMTGRSLIGMLNSQKSGLVDPMRDAVITGRERHAWCRADGAGYPARMLRTRDYLLIRNYAPDRWPAGDERFVSSEGSFGDIDASPSKNFLLKNRDAYPRLHDLAFGKRPEYELYDCRSDPAQLENLADDPTHREILRKLSSRLSAHLRASGDPRETTGSSHWDQFRYYKKGG